MAQLTIFETVKSGVERVGSVVVAGVLVAVALSNFVGLTWWSLGIVIFAALVIGTILRLGDHTLEVPISAMLVLAVTGQAGTAALDRVVETLIGAVTGVVVSFMLGPRCTSSRQATPSASWPRRWTSCWRRWGRS